MLRHPLTLLTREVPALVVSPERTVLLLQDLHAAVVDPDDGWLARRAAEKVVAREFDELFETLRLVAPNVGRLVAACRARGIAIVHSCLGHREGEAPSPFQRATGWEWNLDGPDGAFPEAWRPLADEPVFGKPGWGALDNPALAGWLREREIETAIVAGALFDYGVRQSCHELASAGIGSLVVSDAVAPLTLAGGSQASGSLAHGMTKLRSTAELLDLLAVMDRDGTVLI